MKVVCIKDDWQVVFGPKTSKDPKKDEICTVIDSIQYNHIHAYVLKGYEGTAYASEAFVPLDEYLDQFTGSLTKELEQSKLVTI